MAILAHRFQQPSLPTPDREAAFSIIQAKSFREGELFTLASGRKSRVYFDMKLSMFDPVGALQLPLTMLHRVCELRCNAVGGLEMGAVPVVSSAQTLATEHGIALRSFFVRKEVKGHGTKKLIEGIDTGDLCGCSVAIVDDVTTTGTSALMAVSALKECGVSVKHAVTIVDREEGAVEAFADQGVTLHALFQKSEFTDRV
jgi:orotate phosphoribosyltransferase